jgi:DNA-binding LytR/AlgR family response regulator
MKAIQIRSLPVCSGSVEHEIEKLKDQLRKVQSGLEDMQRQQDQLADKRISVFTQGGYRQLSVNEIILISSEDNYSTIYLDGGAALFTSRTLKYWEDKCSSAELIRVHHSYLIHRQKLISVQPALFMLNLEGGLIAKYSRMSKAALNELLGLMPSTQQDKTPKVLLHPKSVSRPEIASCNVPHKTLHISGRD